MTDLNNVFLIGRLTGDCEVSKGSNGVSYGRFSLAVNRSYQVNGDWRDETSFIDCTMFGDICTTKGPYMQKGKRIGIAGEIRQSRWEKDGKKMSKLEVLVHQIQFLDIVGGGKKDDGKSANEPVVVGGNVPENPAEFAEGNIPF